MGADDGNPATPPGQDEDGGGEWDRLVEQARPEHFNEPEARHVAGVLGVVLRHPGCVERSQDTAQAKLADRYSVDLLDHLLNQPWPGPAVTTAQLVALAILDRRYKFDRTPALVVTAMNYPDRASVVTPSILRFVPSVPPPLPAPQTAEASQ